MKFWRKSRTLTLIQMSNNPNLDIVNINAHKTFGENLSFHSIDIQRKQIYDRCMDGQKNERNDRQPKSYIKRGYNKCDQYTRTGF